MKSNRIMTIHFLLVLWLSGLLSILVCCQGIVPQLSVVSSFPNARPLSTSLRLATKPSAESANDHNRQQQQQPQQPQKNNDKKSIKDEDKKKRKKRHLLLGSSSKKKKKLDQQKAEYERRKKLWLERYGSLEALQSTFGTGPQKKTKFLNIDGLPIFRGDLSPEDTRRLYHTLLPRSLLGLYEMKLMKPEELAPLAYEARIAAKEYARSRCVWYARVGTVAFDQYRKYVREAKAKLGGGGGGGDDNNNDTSTTKRKKKSNSTSMSWDEIWSKYEAQIVQEECAEELGEEQYSDNKKKRKKKKNLSDKDLTMRIYLRILEKSCVTNQSFDQMFLKKKNKKGSHSDDDDPLADMGRQLDRDVREILLDSKDSAKMEKNAVKLEKKLMKERLKKEEAMAKEAKKQWKLRQKLRMEEQEKLEKKKKAILEGKDNNGLFRLPPPAAGTTGDATTRPTYSVVDDDDGDGDAVSSVRPSSQRWQVLRILAATRRMSRRLL